MSEITVNLLHWKSEILATLDVAKQNKLFSKVTVPSVQALDILIASGPPDLMIMPNLASAKIKYPHTFYVFVTRQSAEAELFKTKYNSVKDTVNDFIGEFATAVNNMPQDKPGYLYLKIESHPNQVITFMEALEEKFGEAAVMSQRPTASDLTKLNAQKAYVWYACVASKKSISLIKG